MTFKFKAKKILRFCTIYGFERTLVKIIGRNRYLWWLYPKISWSKKRAAVSVIGCGQFALSTACFFLKKQRGVTFLECFDPDLSSAQSLALLYRFRNVAPSAEDLINNSNLEYLYITSNHSTHSKYAVQALKANVKNIFIEKPLATNMKDLMDLLRAVKKSNCQVFCGYNRPFSRAIKLFKSKASEQLYESSPFTISYFISAHKLESTHWYRNPEEGTRICGNMGHWIDLSVNMLSWRGELPSYIDVAIAYSDVQEPDDNISVTMVSDKSDLINIIMTSRTEPFEGISEVIDIQYGNFIAHIQDFRKMSIWENDKVSVSKFFPKDVGHKRSVKQPFDLNFRVWREIEISSFITVRISEAVLNQERSLRIHLDSLQKKLNSLI